MNTLQYTGALTYAIGLVNFLVCFTLHMTEPDFAMWQGYAFTIFLMLVSIGCYYWDNWTKAGIITQHVCGEYGNTGLREVLLVKGRLSITLSGCWKTPGYGWRWPGGYPFVVGLRAGKRSFTVILHFWALTIERTTKQSITKHESFLRSKKVLDRVRGFSSNDDYIVPFRAEGPNSHKGLFQKGRQKLQEITNNEEAEDRYNVDRLGIEKLGISEAANNLDPFIESLKKAQQIKPLSGWQRFRLWLHKIFHKLF